MSAIRVFVDDYVADRLPGLCVLSGVPTSDRVVERTDLKQLNPAWLLLLFLGPFGWIALLLVFAGHRASWLVGSLPVAEGAFLSYRDAIRRSTLTAVVGGAGMLLIGVFGVDDQIAIPGLVVAAIVAVGGIVWRIVAGHKWPVINLDASGRWVTITGAHPAFVKAAASWGAAQGQRLEPPV